MQEEQKKATTFDKNPNTSKADLTAGPHAKAKFLHVQKTPPFGLIQVKIDPIPQGPDNDELNYEFPSYNGIGVYLAHSTALSKKSHICVRLVWENRAWSLYVQNDSSVKYKHPIKSGDSPTITIQSANLEEKDPKHQDPTQYSKWKVTIDKSDYYFSSDLQKSSASYFTNAGVYCNFFSIWKIVEDDCTLLPKCPEDNSTDNLNKISFTNLALKDFYGNHIDPIWNLGDQSQQTCGMFLTPFNGKLIQDPDTYETTQIDLTWRTENEW